jgi:hypothetical protein
MAVTFDSASSKQIEETGFNAIAGSMPNLITRQV